MKLNRFFRWLLLFPAGGFVLQASASCSSAASDAINSSLSDLLSTVVETQISTYVNQLLGVTS